MLFPSIVLAIFSFQTPAPGWSLSRAHTGTQTYHWYATSCAFIGDINGDGVSDYINGVIATDQADVFSGLDGTLIRQHFGTNAPLFFGSKVAGAGDLDGDQIPDYLIAGGGSSFSGTPQGQVHAFSGATGAILYSVSGSISGSSFGSSLAGGMDFSGDGVPDFVVGAETEDIGPFTAAGKIYAFSGANGSLLYTLPGYSTEGRLGQSLALSEDTNGDGQPDLIAGAHGSSPNGLGTAGQVYVYSATTGIYIVHFDGTAQNDLLGWAVAAPGDLDGDGLADVVASAIGHDQNGSGSGAVFAFSVSSNSIIGSAYGAAANSAFGYSISALGGDGDGDGLGDFIVGAPAHNAWPGDVGSATLFSAAFLDLGTFYEAGSGSHFGKSIAGTVGLSSSKQGVLVSASSYDSSSLTNVGECYLFESLSSLEISRTDIVAGRGGIVQFTVNFDDIFYPGDRVILAGSNTGQGPTVVLGQSIPLTQDWFWNWILSPAGTARFNGSWGALSANGQATIYSNILPGALNNWVGQDFWFAAVAYRPAAGAVVAVSNNVSLHVLP